MAADAYGGNLVNWARTVIAGCETDEAFFASAARAKPGCGGLLFRIGETATSGRWEGIGLHHTADDFARSVLETLTLRMTRKVRAVTPYPQRCRIVLAGGGSRQAVWRKMLSEALGAPVRAIAHDPLAGAARMARDAIRARRTAQPPA